MLFLGDFLPKEFCVKQCLLVKLLTVNLPTKIKYEMPANIKYEKKPPFQAVFFRGRRGGQFHVRAALQMR